MKGKATEVLICGRMVRLGDRVRIRYTHGSMGELEGEVIELWGYDTDGFLQARVDSGWCFHDCDEILSHESAGVEERIKQ